MSKNSLADAHVKAMLKELGRVRRQQAKRIQRRRGLAQMRQRAGQALNVIGYFIIPGIVVTALLSL